MYTILKIPFDKCIVEKERRGAALGPDVIEKEFENLFASKGTKNIVWKNIHITDDFEKLHKEVEIEAAKAYAKDNFVIGLGGDHSVSYGLMKAFAKKFPKKSGLIYFDAHFDCQDDFLPPTHEDILRAVVKENLFGKNIQHIGARNFTEKERKFVTGKIRFCMANLFYATNAPKAVLSYIKNFLNTINHVYVSVDIDAIDPAFAPGTGWPEPIGILPQHFILLLCEILASGKLQGFDIVEVSPPKDINNITARLAATILAAITKNLTRKTLV
ncbi:MAG: arginase family protein [Candidatus Nanoarchaeia archaeon]